MLKWVPAHVDFRKIIQGKNPTMIKILKISFFKEFWLCKGCRNASCKGIWKAFLPLGINESICIKYLFIHVKFCSLGNPIETHLVFMSSPRENTHAVPGSSASTTNNITSKSIRRSRKFHIRTEQLHYAKKE